MKLNKYGGTKMFKVTPVAGLLTCFFAAIRLSTISSLITAASGIFAMAFVIAATLVFTSCHVRALAIFHFTLVATATWFFWLRGSIILATAM